MDKSQLLNLMQFVIDQNKTIVYDSINSNKTPVSDEQLRALILAVEETTKNSFFRMIEKM
jgi:ribulose kinase